MPAHRVLVLAERPAFPSTDGARLRLVTLLRGLQDYPVDFVHLYEPNDRFTPVERLLTNCTTRAAIEHNSCLTNCSRARSVFSLQTNGAMRYSSKRLRQVLSSINPADYSFALLCGLNMTQYASDLAIRRLYVDVCDSEIRHMEVRRQFVSDPLRKAYFAVQRLKAIRQIRQTAGHFNRWFVISDVEQASLASHFPDMKITIIPNSIDLPLLAPNTRQAGLVVFSGNFDFFPNVDAASYFIKNIVPLLRRAVPEVRVRILGKNPPRHLLALRSEAVEITGFRSDFHRLLGEAAVYVCPLRLGTGIKNKVLEAMAAGLPVVSSTAGIEGIGCTAGIHYLQATTPGEFTVSISRALRDSHLSQRLANAARQHVTAFFGTEAVRLVLHEALQERR